MVGGLAQARGEALPAEQHGRAGPTWLSNPPNEPPLAPILAGGEAESFPGTGLEPPREERTLVAPGVVGVCGEPAAAGPGGGPSAASPGL